jgi:16S rRNA (adenine1518-N6/adenine1519-N6)-dimethyltransferase
MVQREVAKRMAAEPCSKDYGAYTVKLRSLVKPCGSFSVARTNFMPPPNVESTVIRLDRLKTPLDAQHYVATAFMADAAFCQRRKTIKNALCAYFAEHALAQDLVDKLLKDADIDPTRRGETLDLNEFIALGKALSAHEGFNNSIIRV